MATLTASIKRQGFSHSRNFIPPHCPCERRDPLPTGLDRKPDSGPSRSAQQRFVVIRAVLARMERSVIRGRSIRLRQCPRIARSLSSGAHSRDPLAPSGVRPLQNKPAQIGVLGEIADVLLHIIGIYLDGLAMTVRRGKGYLVEHA